jgi:DnaJ-class molecular chaperone
MKHESGSRGGSNRINKSYTRKDYFILNLKHCVNFEEVRRAYLKLSLIHHPDKGGDINEFRKINDAYTNILNRKIDHDEDKENDEDKEKYNFYVNTYVVSKSDIRKYEDHLKYKKYFKETSRCHLSCILI